MKVYLGSYPKFIGTHQIAKFFPSFLRKYVEECRWLDRLCNYIYEKKKIKKVVKLHPYDTWSVDYTLSTIIVPLLKQLKDTSTTYAIVDEPDLPEEIKKYSLEAWHWALDMMIEAFSSDLYEWKKDFASGKMDYKIAEDGQIVEGPEHTYKLDEEGYKKKQGRIDRGRQLFAKYYNSLWD